MYTVTVLRLLRCWLWKIPWKKRDWFSVKLLNWLFTDRKFHYVDYETSEWKNGLVDTVPLLYPDQILKHVIRNNFIKIGNKPAGLQNQGLKYIHTTHSSEFSRVIFLFVKKQKRFQIILKTSFYLWGKIWKLPKQIR